MEQCKYCNANRICLMRGDNGIFAWMTKESGGAYHEFIGKVKKIDDYARFIETESGDIIPLDDVFSIDNTDNSFLNKS